MTKFLRAYCINEQVLSKDKALQSGTPVQSHYSVMQGIQRASQYYKTEALKDFDPENDKIDQYIYEELVDPRVKKKH